MTRDVRRRNEKILRNVDFTNFDFVELSEIYIHSGELSRREIIFLRECISKINEMREFIGEQALSAFREMNEAKIAEMLGEARYKRLKLDMEMNTREFCERFLESDFDVYHAEPTICERVCEQISTFLHRLLKKRNSVQSVKGN